MKSHSSSKTVKKFSKMSKPQNIKEMFVKMATNAATDDSAPESAAESDGEVQEVSPKPASSKSKKRTAKSSPAPDPKKRAVNLDPNQVSVKDFQPKRISEIQFKHTIGESLFYKSYNQYLKECPNCVEL